MQEGFTLAESSTKFLLTAKFFIRFADDPHANNLINCINLVAKLITARKTLQLIAKLYSSFMIVPCKSQWRSRNKTAVLLAFILFFFASIGAINRHVTQSHFQNERKRVLFNVVIMVELIYFTFSQCDENVKKCVTSRPGGFQKHKFAFPLIRKTIFFLRHKLSTSSSEIWFDKKCKKEREVVMRWRGSYIVSFDT